MTVVSLFSGAGGLDLGLLRAGHRLVYANDNDASAVATYRRNIGEHIECADIKDINLASLLDADVVVGGFPCQG
ncbi:MAG: DNA cytosine methyltransferase, partial [Kiritimatiellia bacterium]